MPQPTYKLSYFDAKALAETTRFIFAYKNVAYEDNRVPRDQWPTIKASTPFRQLPTLEIDGKVYAQSGAINRLLAKKYHLAGTTDEEQALVDAIFDYNKDIWAANLKWWFEADQAKKTQLRDEYAKTNLPDHLAVLESHLKQAGGEFFASSGVTYADFAVAILLALLEERIPGTLEKHAALKQLVERVHNLPGIKEWVAKRPKNEV